jgi:hypothetical protein
MAMDHFLYLQNSTSRGRASHSLDSLPCQFTMLSAESIPYIPLGFLIVVIDSLLESVAEMLAA